MASTASSRTWVVPSGENHGDNGQGRRESVVGGYHHEDDDRRREQGHWDDGMGRAGSMLRSMPPTVLPRRPLLGHGRRLSHFSTRTRTSFPSSRSHSITSPLLILQEPLHHVALAYSQGLHQGSRDGDVVEAGGELLDSDSIRHGSYVDDRIIYI
jgi:hypothetical protein